MSAFRSLFDSHRRHSKLIEGVKFERTFPHLQSLMYTMNWTSIIFEWWMFERAQTRTE